MNQYMNKNGVFALLFGALLASFFPTYLFSYAFSDDYSSLHQMYSGINETFRWDVSSGRPLYAILRYIAISLSADMGSLIYWRLFSVFSIAFLGCYLFYFINKRSILDSRTERFILAFSLCVVPAFQVYAAWATCFPFALSIILSLSSYDILVSKLRLIPRLLISFILLSCSFAIYQPSAMVFLAFVFLDICIGKKEVKLNDLIRSFIIIFFSLISSLLMVKLIPTLLFGHTISRATIVTNYYEKLLWFIQSPLIYATANYDITINIYYIIFSVIIMLVGCSYILRLNDGLKKVALAILLCIGSFVVNLSVEESSTTFRTIIGMELIISSLFIIGVIMIIRTTKSYSVYLSILFTFALASMSQYNIVRGFVLPANGELQALASDISTKVDKSFTGKLMFDTSTPAFNVFSHVQFTDEFGSISLAYPWSVVGMAEYISRNKGYNFKVPHDAVISDKNPCLDNCIIINSGNAMRDASTTY